MTSPQLEKTADLGIRRTALHGKTDKQGERFVLKVPGLTHIFYVKGGARFNELKQASRLLGRSIQISGKLHGSHGDRPPGMTVESFASLSECR